ncbi:alcohol dehydrogenase groES-like domain-containing protein [Sarocladium implicatum]|nr:alcohol dehydrogenase groES-like domain-containing protein [Sarocladium implicatum]
MHAVIRYALIGTVVAVLWNIRNRLHREKLRKLKFQAEQEVAEKPSIVPVAQTQKAIVVAEVGKPVVLQNNRPIPSPGPHQVLLKVSVAGLNPHDQKVRDYGLMVSEMLPAPLANDVVGTIVELGDAVTDLACGERVMAQAGIVPGCTQNGLQEYALVDMPGGPTPAACRIPHGISDDAAATVPCNVVAPLIALFRTLQIPAPWTAEAKTFDYAGTAILIVGGGSNCGRFAVQLASLVGLGQIVVVGGREHELKGLGATHVIDRHLETSAIVSQIHQVVGDELVYAFDAVNPPAGQVIAINALSSSKKGALARLLPVGAPLDESLLTPKAAGYDLRHLIGVSHANAAVAGEFWARLPAYLEKGKIKPLTNYTVVQNGFDVKAVNDVLDRYRDKATVVKTHIHL